MSRWNKVVIDGVGLIGGSLGMALKQRGLAERVVGVGRSAARLRAALDAGAIDEAAVDAPGQRPAAEQAVAGAEVIVVCTPVDTIAARVERLAPLAAAGGWLMDAGSTKEELCRRIAQGPAGALFLGAHPLAGGHLSGVEAGRADLFEGKAVLLTPTDASDHLRERGAAFWAAVGAAPHVMSPREHDRVLAAASHLPHLAAAALAAATPPDALPWTASGWRDATRIAAADPDLWLSIFAANRGHSLRALDNFAKVLASIREALEQGDAAALRKWLETGKKNRDSVAN